VTTITTSKPRPLGGQKAGGFGRALEQARIAGGISLDEAATATRISSRYLLALEQEELDELPAPIYARGFLRTYAGYLGLDPADVTSLYPVPYIEPALEPVNNPAPVAPSRNLTYLIGGGVCVLVFLLGLLFLTSGGGGSSASPSGSPVTAGATTDPAATQDNGQPITPGGPIGNYVGQNIEEIRATIFTDVGVPLIEVEVPSAEPKGTILQQSLEPGTPVDEQTGLTLTVSDGSGAQ
jgi:Helix-turn-helix domain/PASTA domain